MGNQSQAVPSARGRSAMLYRRARSGLFLIALFWGWMLLGAADFIAALFGSPAYAALAVLALGALTLVSLLFLPICIAYLVLNRPRVPGQADRTASRSRDAHRARLAPVVRMAPPRGTARGAAPAAPAAPAKRRDLAS
ncbi:MULTISPECIES: hypothetical protein [unclassified Arthrobacter]|uniref:hypothetical protein n=1 Tax=unclassified Arthrobacter TaxID=235627 RepID=UPI001E5503CC|nr:MULTISPECIES: hypothetical protein [unclassified Arthrobacter]MCC9144553.1 hypothetical protein [Arthrobacter sp. zg-Y919]MDK1275779.1 hypothetical protein [Arthrobacter sp. zg.Y919]WIB02856.1 hypothetical protein QNO10_13080 [Arthrobacter sp. zg-Y919]